MNNFQGRSAGYVLQQRSELHKHVPAVGEHSIDLGIHMRPTKCVLFIQFQRRVTVFLRTEILILPNIQRKKYPASFFIVTGDLYTKFFEHHPPVAVWS